MFFFILGLCRLDWQMKDEEVSLKMVILEKLRSKVLDQCHRKLGHMGIEITYG